MNFAGATLQAIPRFGGVACWDDPAQLPLGVARIARNVRFTAASVSTRYGFQQQIQFASTAQVAGFAFLRYLPQSGMGASQEYQRILAYTADGQLHQADPFLRPSVLATPFPLQANLKPMVGQAYNKGFVALGDCSKGVQAPLIYDPAAQTCDQVSDAPWGTPWLASIPVRVGQVYRPTVYTQKVYVCTQAGTTGTAEPTWNTGTGAVTGDNAVLWQENTPLVIAALPDPPAPLLSGTPANTSSAITPGSKLWVALTYVNAFGEGINELVNSAGVIDPGRVLAYVNTTGAAVGVTITIPNAPAIVSVGGPLGQAYGVLSFNVYAYLQQPGSGSGSSIDPSYYAQVAGPLASGATLTIATFPVGAALNQTNTATVTPEDGGGAVDQGVRWMVPMFYTRTNYITGWDPAIPFRVNVTASGQRVRVLNAPSGPANITKRIFAFTVAGASAAGPYTYIPQSDVENPGFNLASTQITATLIPDNTTTGATFNFTDTYLPGALDVTNYANRIQVLPASDAYFAKSIGAVVYAGCQGYDFLISDNEDPEAVRVPGSNIAVSSSDGDRCVCWREIRDTQIALKENSGHAVIPNGGDPQTWSVQEIWRGMGPVGPKAVDVSTEDDSVFMVFAHRSAPYRFNGSVVEHIGRELIGTPENPGVWDRINWAAAVSIRVAVDPRRKEVRFFVPLDGAPANSHVLTLNYFYGWSAPVEAGSNGGTVANVFGRKWSVDDFAAADAVLLPQRYSQNPAQAGVNLAYTFTAAGPGGALHAVVEGVYADGTAGGKTAGYFSQWVGVPGNSVPRNVFGLIGSTVSARGAGALNVYCYDQAQTQIPLSLINRQMILSTTETVRDFGSAGRNSTAYGIGFDNGGVAGAWFDVHLADLYLLRRYWQQAG